MPSSSIKPPLTPQRRSSSLHRRARSPSRTRNKTTTPNGRPTEPILKAHQSPGSRGRSMSTPPARNLVSSRSSSSVPPSRNEARLAGPWPQDRLSAPAVKKSLFTNSQSAKKSSAKAKPEPKGKGPSVLQQLHAAKRVTTPVLSQPANTSVRRTPNQGGTDKVPSLTQPVSHHVATPVSTGVAIRSSPLSKVVEKRTKSRAGTGLRDPYDVPSESEDTGKAPILRPRPAVLTKAMLDLRRAQEAEAQAPPTTSMKIPVQRRVHSNMSVSTPRNHQVPDASDGTPASRTPGRAPRTPAPIPENAVIIPLDDSTDSDSRSSAEANRVVPNGTPASQKRQPVKIPADATVISVADSSSSSSSEETESADDVAAPAQPTEKALGKRPAHRLNDHSRDNEPGRGRQSSLPAFRIANSRGDVTVPLRGDAPSTQKRPGTPSTQRRSQSTPRTAPAKTLTQPPGGKAPTSSAKGASDPYTTKSAARSRDSLSTSLSSSGSGVNSDTPSRAQFERWKANRREFGRTSRLRPTPGLDNSRTERTSNSSPAAVPTASKSAERAERLNRTEQYVLTGDPNSRGSIDDADEPSIRQNSGELPALAASEDSTTTSVLIARQLTRSSSPPSNQEQAMMMFSSPSKGLDEALLPVQEAGDDAEDDAERQGDNESISSTEPSSGIPARLDTPTTARQQTQPPPSVRDEDSEEEPDRSRHPHGAYIRNGIAEKRRTRSMTEGLGAKRPDYRIPGISEIYAKKKEVDHSPSGKSVPHHNLPTPKTAKVANSDHKRSVPERPKTPNPSRNPATPKLSQAASGSLVPPTRNGLLNPIAVELPSMTPNQRAAFAALPPPEPNMQRPKSFEEINKVASRANVPPTDEAEEEDLLQVLEESPKWLCRVTRIAPSSSAEADLQSTARTPNVMTRSRANSCILERMAGDSLPVMQTQSKGLESGEDAISPSSKGHVSWADQKTVPKTLMIPNPDDLAISSDESPNRSQKKTSPTVSKSHQPARKRRNSVVENASPSPSPKKQKIETARGQTTSPKKALRSETPIPLPRFFVEQMLKKKGRENTPCPESPLTNMVQVTRPVAQQQPRDVTTPVKGTPGSNAKKHTSSKKKRKHSESSCGGHEVSSEKATSEAVPEDPFVDVESLKKRKKKDRRDEDGVRTGDSAKKRKKDKRDLTTADDATSDVIPEDPVTAIESPKKRKKDRRDDDVARTSESPKKRKKGRHDHATADDAPDGAEISKKKNKKKKDLRHKVVDELSSAAGSPKKRKRDRHDTISDDVTGTSESPKKRTKREKHLQSVSPERSSSDAGHSKKRKRHQRNDKTSKLHRKEKKEKRKDRRKRESLSSNEADSTSSDPPSSEVDAQETAAPEAAPSSPMLEVTPTARQEKKKDRKKHKKNRSKKNKKRDAESRDSRQDGIAGSVQHTPEVGNDDDDDEDEQPGEMTPQKIKTKKRKHMKKKEKKDNNKKNKTLLES
ncbi:hypothetical protein F4778DRAFT_782945 [Xylariomycetidae sp. FL2044]|nr:hypothetical protein F4778DRAFT_782945 [Xylariomycetidae sp. FL2044]